MNRRNCASRNGKAFSQEELLAIADTLQQMTKLRNLLLKQLNRRVLVKWLDPLLTYGKAHRYYDKLRCELDNDWLTFVDNEPRTSPFYGEIWNEAAR